MKIYIIKLVINKDPEQYSVEDTNRKVPWFDNPLFIGKFYFLCGLQGIGKKENLKTKFILPLLNLLHTVIAFFLCAIVTIVLSQY